MQPKGKSPIRRTLAEQLSASFDDALAEIALSMDEMAQADDAPAPASAEPLDFLLDDIERAIDSVLQEREKTLSQR